MHMDYVEYANNWAKSEVSQGRIMIGLGLIMLFIGYRILISENVLLKGSLVPLGLLVFVLIGYGGYILYSRPAHVKETIALYQKSRTEAIEKEKEKHINDNKAGKTLMKYIYPSLIIVSALALFFVPHYYKGMALGFIVLFLSIYIIDNGFVSRSDAFIELLNGLKA